jgi:hypothetical protein
MPAITFHSPVMDERRPPTLADEAADVLERAASRLEKPGAWIQGDLAQSSYGNVIGPTAPGARCWCALGSLDAEDSDRGGAFQLANWALSARVGSVPTWNDAPERTQAEVVAELRAAAADLRGAQ